MARSRNIKPGFFVNEELSEIEPLGRILFIGLWCIADREGRLEDRPKKIKSLILPFDNCDTNQLLNMLHTHGLIVRYEFEDNNYIYIPKFFVHQHPHHREPPSVIPPFKKASEIPVQALGQAQPKPVAAGLIPDSLLLIPLKENIYTSSDDDGALSDFENQSTSNTKNVVYDEWFLRLYEIYPRKAGKQKAHRIYKKIVEDKALVVNGEKVPVTFYEVENAIELYANEVEHQEEKFIKHFDTFMRSHLYEYVEKAREISQDEEL